MASKIYKNPIHVGRGEDPGTMATDIAQTPGVGGSPAAGVKNSGVPASTNRFGKTTNAAKPLGVVPLGSPSSGLAGGPVRRVHQNMTTNERTVGFSMGGQDNGSVKP